MKSCPIGELLILRERIEGLPANVSLSAARREKKHIHRKSTPTLLNQYNIIVQI